MTAVVIAMCVLACGAWLRYAVVPVVAAYELGKRVGAARRGATS